MEPALIAIYHRDNQTVNRELTVMKEPSPGVSQSVTQLFNGSFNELVTQSFNIADTHSVILRTQNPIHTHD